MQPLKSLRISGRFLKKFLPRRRSKRSTPGEKPRINTQTHKQPIATVPLLWYHVSNLCPCAGIRSAPSNWTRRRAFCIAAANAFLSPADLLAILVEGAGLWSKGRSDFNSSGRKRSRRDLAKTIAAAEI
jgi:hypothetical protein